MAREFVNGWAELHRSLPFLCVLLLLSGCRSFDSGSSVEAIRFAENPVVTPQSSETLGENINGPSLIRVPGWVQQPLGRYYLYFAHHGGKYIRLAYANTLQGPWRVYEPGTLRLQQASGCYDHVASPDVHVDESRRQIVMYYHCPAGSSTSLDIGQQKTFVAVSTDGIHFSSRPQALGPAYFRVFRWQGYYYAIVRAGILFRSRDPFGAYEEGPHLFSFGPGILLRHAAVHLRDNELWVYYSRIGDRPERILVSRVTLTGDWSSWQATPPQTVLSPDMPYEGSAFPVDVSRPDEAQQVRQLRDPAVYQEGRRTYLVYSIAGESGLAIAELRYR